MPNRSYRKGASFEYQVKKFYEKADFMVFRTAGSHSPIDLIAISRYSGHVLLIQCKNYRVRPSDVRYLTEFSKTMKYHEIILVSRSKKRGEWDFNHMPGDDVNV